MVCGSLNEIDQGGGGGIQPLNGSAMAPRRSYHSEKLGILHCLIGFPLATSNAVIGRLTFKGYFHFGDVEKCSRRRALEISTWKTVKFYARTVRSRCVQFW
jgi:hypothetical protein